MDEVRPPRRKCWFKVKRWLKRRRSDDNLQRQRRGAMPDTASQPTQNTSQPASHRRRSGLSEPPNMFNTCHTPIAEQSPPDIHSSTAPRRSSDHPSEVLSPHTVPASDTNVVQGTNSGTAKVEQHVPKKAVDNATKAFADIKNVSGTVRNAASATDKLQSVSDVFDTIDPIIRPLKIFNSILNMAAEVHPYAKVVLSIFTCASKMILDQKDRDDAVQDLLKRLSDVYDFMNEDKRLAEIESMHKLYGKMARQTLECADFIVNYSKAKSYWKRLSRNVFEETAALIESYNDAFDTLMEQFRDEAVRDIVVNVHRFAEDMDFNNMIYAEGAGQDTYKKCLPGTREDILSEIKTWISSTGNDVKSVFWLNGTAGKGKSAIAHTIADWYIECGGPGAFFCFDRTREADKRHEKMFTTIARDLVDGNPIIRRALANAVRDNNRLRHAIDITKQWQELILGPVNAAAKVDNPPVLIVIDALDESGDWRSREQILRALTGQLNQGTTSSNQMKLPVNIRILVTSRPLNDIDDYLHGASHVRHFPMDDPAHVSKESAEHDIQIYVSTRLKHAESGDLNRLAVKSDGLFEWARLACDYILGTNTVAEDKRKRFEAVLAGKSEKGTRLLDDMYRRILEDIMPKDEHEESIPIFCSVMGQIIASLEPLPCTALTTMQRYFPLDSDRYNVERVIHPLGSLLTGTTDPHILVRPLHASFYDFLTDKPRSKDFFVDVSSAQRNLAFASLGVSKDQLRFNICSLKSSYLQNSDVPDLGDRMKNSISAELSYSCRFWGTHVSATPVERLLVEEVKALFDNERLLFWLEVVGLLKVVGGAVATLSCIADWLKDYSGHTDAVDAIVDTRRFLRTFAPAILRSTPHLYLSALPFAPTESIISKKFVARFPSTPRVVAGYVAHWPSLEKVIPVSSVVRSVAIFPDGRRIACGSEDGTIHVRDMETGEALGAALLGHTEGVLCIAISSNGRRIVSGSEDRMVRVWDADTGKALGAPLEGHDDEVCVVAISPNGNRVVSASAPGFRRQMLIKVWDIDTGKALGDPPKGWMHYADYVAISLDRSRIVSDVAGGNTLRIWDIDAGNALGEPLRGHNKSICSITISPKGNYIVSGSFDETIQMWDATTGQALGEPLKGHDDAIFAIAISPDENFIISGSRDCTIRVWDARTHEPWGMPLRGHTRIVLSIAVSPDGRRIVSSADDKTIRVWDVGTRNVSTAPIESHRPRAWISAAISLDGKRIVSGSEDDMIRVWDTSTGQALGAPLRGTNFHRRGIAISSDGKHIAFSSYDRTIRVLEATTAVTLLHKHIGDMVECIAFSSDGRHIVFGTDGGMVYVWNLTDDAPITPLQGRTGSVSSIAISLDGDRIVSSFYDDIRVWDAMTGKALFTLQGHYQSVWAVAISRDGKRVASGANDNKVGVWDASTGKQLFAPLQGHTCFVRPVAISLDGNIIVSGSDDGTIRVWNVANGNTMGVLLQVHIGEIRSLSISSDNKRIVSCGDDETARVWDLEFFTQPQLSPAEPPVINFSSNPIHALRSPSSFSQGLHTPVPLLPNEEGWVVGPDGRLLLWVPASLCRFVYVHNMLVAPGHASQFDLSHFAHGESWQKCRISGH